MATAFYKCDLCGEIFSSYQEALNCEKEHPKPVSIVKWVGYGNVRLLREFPEIVIVLMSDGHKWAYTLVPFEEQENYILERG